MTRTFLLAGDGPSAHALADRLASQGDVARLHASGAPASAGDVARDVESLLHTTNEVTVVVTAYARRDPGGFLAATPADFGELIAREVTMPFLVAQAAARVCVGDKRSGRIVHVIERSDGNSMGSAVTERACRLMIAATALDLLPDGVRVCGVSGAAGPSGDDGYAATIAEAVGFCASDDASYVVGSTFDPWGAGEERRP